MQPEAPGFRRLGRGDAVLAVATRFEASAHALGLLEADGLARLLETGQRQGGRGRTTRVELPGAGARLLLRPVLHGGLLGPLLGAALLGLRRPLAELEITAALRAAGAPVPVPVLVAGRRAAGPIWNAAVGTLFEEGTRNARRFLELDPPPEAVIRAAAAAGRAVRRFHDAGGRHRDLHVENILLREHAATTEAIVIDLDRARRVERVTPAARMAELMRLYRSLRKRGVLERVGARGCARFFAAYVDGDRALRRALRAHLARERLRVSLHALAYRRP